MDAELVVTPPGCSHLSSFKVDNWKQNLRAIYQCFVWSGTAEARKRKAKSCVCHVCGVHLNRLHSCLHCVFFGCFTKKHIHEHAKSKRHNLGKAPSDECPWCGDGHYPACCSLSRGSQLIRGPV